MRQHVSSRLAETRATTTVAKGETLRSNGNKRTAVKKGKAAALALEAAAAIGRKPEGVKAVEDNDGGGADGIDNDNDLGGERDQLSGADLLEACDRLENDNLGLRQRLAKLELQKMQKEHDKDDEELNDDSQLAPVMIDSRSMFVRLTRSCAQSSLQESTAHATESRGEPFCQPPGLEHR